MTLYAERNLPERKVGILFVSETGTSRRHVEEHCQEMSFFFRLWWRLCSAVVNLESSQERARIHAPPPPSVNGEVASPTRPGVGKLHKLN